MGKGLGHSSGEIALAYAKRAVMDEWSLALILGEAGLASLTVCSSKHVQGGGDGVAGRWCVESG